MALLDSLVGKAPDPKFVGLDKDAQGLIDQGVQNASQSPQELAQSLNQGIDRSGSLGASPEQLNQQTASMGTAGSPTGDVFTKALLNSYSQIAGPAMDKQKEENSINSMMQKRQKLKSMAVAAMGQQQAKTQNYSMLTQAYNQNEMARAQFVSTLFQTANSYMAYHSSAQKPQLSMQLPGTISEGAGTPGTPGAYAPQGMGGIDTSNIG